MMMMNDDDDDDDDKIKASVQSTRWPKKWATTESSINQAVKLDFFLHNNVSIKSYNVITWYIINILRES